MSTTSQLIMQGAMKRFSTKGNKWVDKYYVLHGGTERNASRLDWYDNKKAYVDNPSVRTTLFVEEIQRIDRFVPTTADDIALYGSDAKLMLKLRTYRSSEKAEMLVVKSEKEADRWASSINQLVEAARTQSLRSRTVFSPETCSPEECYQPFDTASVTFDVEVDDTAAANLCNLYGNYRVVLSSNHVTLVDRSNTPVLCWEYCNIRRYGFSSDRFTLEGGHKAGRAAGLFIFKNCLGSSIRSAIEGKMREYQRMQRSIQQQQQQQQQQPGTGTSHGDYSYTYVNFNEKTAGSGGAMSPEPPPSPALSATGKTTPAAPVLATKPKPKPAPAPRKVASIQSNGSTSPETAKNGFISRTSSSSSGGSSVSASGRPPLVSRSASRSSEDSHGDSQTPKITTPSAALHHQHFAAAASVPKMSHVLDELNKFKMAKQTSPDYHNEYESIDLIKAVTARTKSSSLNYNVRSNDDDVRGGYDPTHLYGPIESTATGSGAMIATVPESEYAEIGGR